MLWDFAMAGTDHFPGWLSVLFSLGLAMGIVHHLPCLIGGHGSRWLHGGHVAMAVSMIYMYLSMSFGWDWLPGMWQMWFFVVSSIGTGAYLLGRLIRGLTVNFCWVLALIQHVAMIYMWYPMMRWNAVVIFLLVSWFAVETFGWTANLFPDDVRILENRRWFPYEVGSRQPASASAGGRGPVTVLAGRSARGVATSVGVRGVHYLTTSYWMDRAAMAFMAVSMGYMFYGMGLMR